MFGRNKARREKDKKPAPSSEAGAQESATVTAAEAEVAEDVDKSRPPEGVASQDAGVEPTAQQSPAGDTGQTPPLYQHPVPLSKDSHGDWHLRQDRDFGFAAGATLVPLNAAEFPLASRHYPIVFGAQGQIALAVLGASGGNAFVGEEGDWRPGTYVPAYIRRYPFLFMAVPDNKFVLSIDDAYEGFGSTGDPLFVDGEVAEITQNALAFCQIFEREIGATSLFIAGLEEAGLLSSDLPSFNRAGGRKLTVKGVRAVDSAGFDALPDEVIVDWRQKGWLPAVYAHLNSMSNWDLLGR
jgi:hypothetical protein